MSKRSKNDALHLREPPAGENAAVEAILNGIARGRGPKFGK
jgi:hypothetical protein